MSSPANNFLSLIPTSHRLATISGFGNEESVVPIIQKTRRSSSTATSDSSQAADEPSVPKEIETVASPTDEVAVSTAQKVDGLPAVTQPIAIQPIRSFLKLGN